MNFLYQGYTITISAGQGTFDGVCDALNIFLQNVDNAVLLTEMEQAIDQAILWVEQGFAGVGVL